MKRLWIGVGLLLAMLLSGILVTEFMERTHNPDAKDLKRAAQLAMEDEWDKAEALTTRVQKSWDKRHHWTASFADHEPIEEVEGLLAQLKVYGELRDVTAFSGTCVQLAKCMEALGECHSLNFWNLM